MELWKAYIRQKGRGILAFGLFAGIFFVTFALYQLPLEAVAYPFFLCFLAALYFFFSGYFRLRKTHRQLCAIQKQAQKLSAVLPVLPKAKTLEEQDYQALIGLLQEQAAALSQQAAGRYEEMVEYYTLWVHQIKTPIASMELTLQNEDTPLSRKLSAELRRIEQYVEMVLAFLRLDHTSTDYVFEEHDLDTILRQSVAKFAAEFIDRRLSLVYEPVNQTVLTDDKWFAFVMEQILSNALKYTKKGSIRIYMDKPGVLVVADTGIGIGPEDLPRIFEKGFTGYNGRRDKRASGIGLYLCRRICENLGIGLTVRSMPDEGTTVLLDLNRYPLKTE